MTLLIWLAVSSLAWGAILWTTGRQFYRAIKKWRMQRR